MILLINTANYISFVGLSDGNKLVKKKIWEANLRQSEELLSAVDNLVGKQKIDGIIVVTGPGSYTGLRVGVATANALGFGWNCKVVGVDRFEILELKNKKTNFAPCFARYGASKLQIPKNKNYVVILENINDLVYAEVVSSKQKVERIVCSLDELCDKIKGEVYFVGQVDFEKEKIIKNKLKDKFLGIIKRNDFDEEVLNNLVEIGLERLKEVKLGEIVKPYYLREPHITKPRRVDKNV